MIQLYGIVIFFLMGSMAIADQQSADQVSLQQLSSKAIERIAFGSCAKQWRHQAIWDSVIATRPDLFVYLGDAIYADTDGKTVWDVSQGQLPGDWQRLADKPDFQRARAKIPFMATWDNHDYGAHAGGAEFKLKQASKTIFLDFFGEPAESQRRQRDGVYDAKIFGPADKRVQVILLDTKYNRSAFKKDPSPNKARLVKGKVGGYLPDDDPAKTMLGDRQWRWLEEQLKKPAEVHLIASSIQVIPDQKGMNEWGNFPRERQRLFDRIAKTEHNGIILLSGNVHFAELSKSDAGAYPLYELTSSGMTHVDPSYARAANRFRIAGPFVEHNFGMVEINWETKPSPRISLSVIDENGNTGFSQPFSQSDLKASDAMDKQQMVACTEPRPQVCTQDYRPVCAVRQDGGFNTYSNGCSACSDPAVTGYRDGTCE